MANRKEIFGTYKELKGVLASIETENSWFQDEGFVAHANVVIERAGSVCPKIQDIHVYKLQTDVLRDGRIIVHTTQAKQKLSSLIGRVEGLYSLEELKPNNGGNTFIQNQSQNQSQYLGVALEMQEKILAEIPNHAAGTKERTFLEKLKESLPLIKSATDILSSALKIGGSLGLDPATIHKLLGL
jgi:hypothetical protein